MPAGLGSSEASLLGLQAATLLLSFHMAIPLCVHTLGVPSFSYKDTSHIELRPHNGLILTYLPL